MKYLDKLLEYSVADINDKEDDLKRNIKADNTRRKRKKSSKDITRQASRLRARIMKRAGGIGRNMSDEITDEIMYRLSNATKQYHKS